MSLMIKYVGKGTYCVEYLKIMLNCLTCRAVSLTAMWAFQNQRSPAGCSYLGQNVAALLGHILLQSFHLFIIHRCEYSLKS